ncbi:MAG: FtsX-like permease family protein [Bacteroidales bacterium]|nr:FtsX-like permease family protein [Bacteroidales bacterium]MCF8456876.1 FtsX-like permease family protein [Bacteroidales bacterium]
MGFPFYIARRYLVSKKSTNVINIISGISIFGVAIGTIALIIVLSVFNGLDGLIKSLFGTFDPDIKISIVEGKRFDPANNARFLEIKNLDGIRAYTEVIEENALIRYNKKEYVATLKGVDQNYQESSGIDTMVVDGQFMLTEGTNPYALLGYGVASTLGVGLNFIDPLIIYVPRRSVSKTISLENSTNRKFIFPSGIFSVQQEIDSRFVIVPIEFARELFEYETEISSVEIALKPDYDSDKIKDQIKKILGPEFKVKDRFEQQELIYKTIKSEKLMGFLILAFILFVASFNIIGSLTMLIIDKKKDIETLRSLGANFQSIRQIFLLEGWLISISGALIGLLLGILFVVLQQKFGFIKLQGNGAFIIDSYPVLLQLKDVLAVFGTVLLMGFFAAWYPVRYITKKFL